MTSFTDDLLVAVFFGCARSPEGDWSSVKETAGQNSSEPVVVLVNDYLIHRNAEFLSWIISEGSVPSRM
jgi:hypothetical protein